jgi:outer membrane protein assembly factor BamA
VGSPTDWGLADGLCSSSANDSIGSSLLNYHLSATVRRPAFLTATSNLSVSVYTERRSEFRVYLRRETGTTVTLRREQLRRRIPLSLAYNLSYGRTEATAVSFCASFNACTPDVVSLLQQNRVLGTLTGTATIPRVNSLIDPSRGSLKSLEVTLSSRFIGSASFQQFTRAVADAAWYRPLARNVVLSWHVRGGAIFAPTVDVATQRGSFVPPEHRFYAGGPNDVRGFERNELGPVVYVVSKAEVDAAAAENRAIENDSVRVSATGGNTLAVGNVELRVPSPFFGSRLRLAAFVDAGGAWQRGDGDPVVRVTPGIGLRVATPLGPARLDMAYNPYRLQAGPLFQFAEDGTLSPVPGREEFVLDRDGRFTFHFAVGQPF